MAIDLRLALPDTAQIVGMQPVMVKCREHKDKQASLAVYADGLYCFGCGFAMQSDVHAALRYLLKTDDVDEARYTNESLDAYRERATAEAKRTPLPFALANAYNTILTFGARKHRATWLRERGLDWNTIAENKLGHTGFAFAIPVFDADFNLLTFRFRRDEEYSSGRGPKYWGLPGRNGAYVFGESWLAAEKPKTVVITEGELDCLRLQQEGVAAAAITNGAGQVYRLPKMLREAFPSIEKLLVATDTDEPGREAGRLTVEAALALGFEVRLLSWDAQYKDVTEALAAGLTVKELLNG